jgi:hypothetical protein
MTSADHEYAQAQRRWKECIDLSVFDDEGCIAPVTALLRRCLTIDPEHVHALRLLGYLSVQRGADKPAKRCAQQVLRLLPADEATLEQMDILERGTRDQRLDWVERRWRGDWSGPFPVQVGAWRSALPAFPLTDEQSLDAWLVTVPGVAEKLLPRLFQGGKVRFRPALLAEIEKELPPSARFYEKLNDPLRHVCSWLAGEIFRRRHKGKWVVQVDYPRYDDFGLPEVRFPDNAALRFFMLLGRFGPERDGGSLLELFQNRQASMQVFWEKARHPVPYDNEQLKLVRLGDKAQFEVWLKSVPQLVRRGIRALADEHRDRLDYSPESLDALERLLLLTPPFGSSVLFSEKWLDRTTWVAAYVGEVARRRQPSWDWGISFSRNDANRAIPWVGPGEKEGARLFPLLLILEFADRRKPGFLRKALAKLRDGETHANR